MSLMSESSTPTQRRLKSVKDLVRQLPLVNAATLKALLTHFWMIDQVKETNCMVSEGVKESEHARANARTYARTARTTMYWF